MQEKAMESEDPVVRHFVYNFAWLWSAFAIAYIIIITVCNIPEKNIRFVDVVLGFIMGTVVSTILNFFFGSSQGSKQKSQELSKR
jgi:multisubunit Na+/H+ antiporter MnhE subunit